jgi:CRISPR/Cas system-associated protein endoribonuclease Cas2
MEDLLRLDYGYKAFMRENAKDAGDWILVGNTKSFKTRKYVMSTQEANMVSRWSSGKMLEANGVRNFLRPADLELWQKKSTQDLFSEYFTDSFEATLTKMNAYGSAINVMNTAMVSSALSDKDTIRVISQDIIDAGVPVSKGFERVQSRQLKEKVERMTSVFEDNESMKQFVKSFLSDNNSSFVEIDKNVYEMIGRLGNMKDINGFVRMLDLTNASFKKLKIFSAGFHFKNLVGNASNLYLAGVPAHKIGPLLVRGVQGKKVGREMLDLLIKEGDSALVKMTEKQQKMLRAYQIFIDAGMEDAGKKIWDLDELMTKAKNHELNANEKMLKGVRKFKEGAAGEGDEVEDR